MLIKLANKLSYKIITIIRQFFYYFRFFKHKKNYWSVKNFENYQNYINFQRKNIR